jgi:hypothetical protein
MASSARRSIGRPLPRLLPGFLPGFLHRFLHGGGPAVDKVLVEGGLV